MCSQNVSDVDVEKKPDPSTFLKNISRRKFVQGFAISGAGLVLGLQACSTSDDDDSPAAEPNLANPEAPEYSELDTYISIADTGLVQLTIPHPEMGQGVRTSLAMIIAEELDADWRDVRVVQATADARYGKQSTGESFSINRRWLSLRRAGATVRAMLLQAASDRLGVPVGNLRVANSQVVDEAGDSRITFGELAAAAALLEVPSDAPLKSETDFSLIGTSPEGVDFSDMTIGQAVYSSDVELPGMLHVSIERSPAVGGKLVSYYADAALAVPGVQDVIPISAFLHIVPEGVAVVADNTWAAMRGREVLEIVWDLGNEDAESTETLRDELTVLTRQEGKPALNAGDFDTALSNAERVIEGTYHSPYQAHAPMEPLSCTTHVSEDGCELWIGTQAPQAVKTYAALFLGIDEANVKVNVTLLGGSFGRRAMIDFPLEAVAVAREIDAPVKITWSREDDTKHDFYRSEGAQRLRATLDAEGDISGIEGITVFTDAFKVFVPNLYEPRDVELSMGWSSFPYAIDNIDLQYAGRPSDLNIGWWRSVGHNYHAFAINSLLDEVARATQKDAPELHKSLLTPGQRLPLMDTDHYLNTVLLGVDDGSEPKEYFLENNRLIKVIEEVSAMGLWGKSVADGEGLGFAVHASMYSYVALVLHVSVDETNKVSVLEADYAVDCGIAVNPDGVKAQVEGGLVFGLSAALYGQITVERGVVQENNYGDFPVVRMDNMPRVNIKIIASSEPPSGMGEPATPVVAPALCNAISAATGERIRQLPISRSGFS